MAGTYPDVPGYRFAYDKDGTVCCVYKSNGSNSLYSSATLQIMNNDGFDKVWTQDSDKVSFLFPEPRNISGILYNTQSSNGTLQWSNDTTNGDDGTWNLIDSVSSLRIATTSTKSLLRTGIWPVDLSNVIAFSIFGNYGSNTYMYNLHLYGSIATTDSLDRLRIVDMNGNDIAAQLDFGDIRQRNNSTKQFRVVNNSDTKTANNITITFDAPTDASPSLIGQYQLSTDNTAFANAINIGSLAPGASSGTLYVRDTVAANAQLSVWSLRIIASANTWS